MCQVTDKEKKFYFKTDFLINIDKKIILDLNISKEEELFRFTHNKWLFQMTNVYLFLRKI